MSGIRGFISHRRAIPAHIEKLLLKMPDIDGCWVGISPRRGLRRVGIIAVDGQRQEVERRALERGLSAGDYALYQVARRRQGPGEGTDQAFKDYERLNWTRWMGGQ
jgi:hypothetical protein